MKLVIDARESGTTTGRYVDKLVENLAKLSSSLEFTILTKPHRVNEVQRLAPNFKILESNYKEFTFAEQLGLKKQLKSLKADLVHFSMTQQPAFYRGKTVTTIHDLTTVRFYNPSKNWFAYKFKQIVYSWLIKRVARRSKIIITPSHYVKGDVVRFSGVNPDKVRVTYEAADKITDVARPVRGVRANKFIMYTGRPNPHKNLGRLVAAYMQLHVEDPSLQLVLVGKKDVLYAKHEAEIQKIGLKNVIFTDHVSEAQLRWLYENTRAYVFPSLSEGFGLPGLEAMMHGAPVVSSSATCLPEVYGDAAHYFDPEDAADMAAKIKDVIEDKKLREQLIADGKKQAAKYSWQQMAKQTLAIYEEVLQEV